MPVLRTRLQCQPAVAGQRLGVPRSGLFGRADNQEGAVPVTLTLQQLMRMHSLADGIYTTAMDLKPKGATIPRCETDFVVLTTRGHDRKVQIAVGECKTR